MSADDLKQAFVYVLSLAEVPDGGHEGVENWAQDATARLFEFICDRDTHREQSNVLQAVLQYLLEGLGHATINVMEMEYTLDNLPKPSEEVTR